MKHELKTWPEFFRAIIDGRKTFELRKRDRAFKVGDTLHLRELSPASDCYTGAETDVTVTYVMKGGQFGVDAGFCVMGIAALPRAGAHVDRLRVALAVQQSSARRWAKAFRSANRAAQKKQARIEALEADRAQLRASLDRLMKAEDSTCDAFEREQIIELEGAIEQAKQSVAESEKVTANA